MSLGLGDWYVRVYLNLFISGCNNFNDKIVDLLQKCNRIKIGSKQKTCKRISGHGCLDVKKN